MDALLKEKVSMDQHDLEANPIGKPEAEGPAGGDATVRKTYRAHMHMYNRMGLFPLCVVYFVCVCFVYISQIAIYVPMDRAEEA